MIPYLDEIQFHFSRPPIPRSVATIIRDHTHALLREKPPELEMNPDVVSFTPSSPQQLVPMIA
jgi:hypothetical protein